MRYILLSIAVILMLQKPVQAQFVDITQVEPYASVTSVCQGGVLTFRLNNLQNLNAGSIITMEISNPGSGYPWTPCVTLASSPDNITYTPGNYVWASNIANSYIRVQLPAGAPPNTGYTARAVSSTPAISGGNNNGSITITNAYSTVLPIAQNTYGINEWIGHHYTWTPSVSPSTLLNTPALVATQNFFDPLNYLGHTTQTPLSFDNDYQNNGIPGSFFNQTSIACTDVQYSNVAIRFMRTQNFVPGRYAFEIQGDDGIRFSLDGGVTWILDSFIEQQYINSLSTTNTAFPSGICLGGPTNLVVEFFQRPAQARATFRCIPLTTLTATPTNQTICAGQNASFDATATVAGASYQWEVSTDGGLTWNSIPAGAPYSNVNGPVLGITAASIALNNNQYRCSVGNLCGAPLLTPPALLSVAPQNTITTQPTDVTLCGSTSTNFSVGTSATGGTFQWYVSTDGGISFSPVVQGGIFGNPALPTLTLTGLGAVNNGYQFYCIVGSCTGNITSNTATLTLGGTPAVINLQPPDTVIACQTAASQIIINASNQTSIQWEYSTNGGVTFSDCVLPVFSGAQTQTLQISPVAANMDGWVFWARVVGCNGVIYSQTTVLKVTDSPSIQTQPPAQLTVCAGGSLSVSCTGNNVTTYQWQLNAGAGFINLANLGGITGANSSTLIVNPLPAGWANALLQCQVFGNCPPIAVSNTVAVTIDPGAAITTQPQNTTVCPFGNATFFVSTSGTGLSYSWEFSTNAGVTYTPFVNGTFVSGANLDTLTLDSLPLAANGMLVRCVVSGGCNGNVISQTALLTINTSLPTISQQPLPVTVCEDQSVNYSLVLNSFAAPVSYQWQIGSAGGIFTDLTDSAGYSGTTTNQLGFTATASLNQKVFRCLVISCTGAVVSNNALLTVNLKPRIDTQPSPPLVCIGQNGLISVAGTGSNLSYQWQVSAGNGIFTNVPPVDPVFQGGTNTSLLITNGDLLYNGFLFRCNITGTCSPSLFSDVVKLTVSEIPEIITQPTDVTICEGQSGAVTIKSRGVASRFLWYNANPEDFTYSTDFPAGFDSTQSDSLQISKASFTHDGKYLYCQVTGCNRLLKSVRVQLHIEPNEVSSFIPSAFTPNNDQLNDTWMIESDYILSVEGEIYNRWGQKVHVISSVNDVWDGNFQGIPCEAGAYAFNLRGQTTCGEFFRKGGIFLLK